MTRALAPDRYELATLRDWYRDHKPSLAYACEELGYWRMKANHRGRQPDIRRLERDLGLKGERAGQIPRRHTSYEKAVRLARALGAEPWEVGL